MVRRVVGLTEEERFWQYVDKTAGGCWAWTGARSHGYGHFMLTIQSGNTRRPSVQAHRYAYRLLVGPVPDGLVLDHLCRNKLCVRPSHLDAVTQRENTLRGDAALWGTTCRKGHPFDAANTYLRKDGYRVCKTCRADTHRRFRERRRAAG